MIICAVCSVMYLSYLSQTTLTDLDVLLSYPEAFSYFFSIMGNAELIPLYSLSDQLTSCLIQVIVKRKNTKDKQGCSRVFHPSQI